MNILAGHTYVGIDLSGRNFLGQKLQGIKFIECNLRKANFGHADLTDAEFDSCDMEKSRFQKAILVNTKFAESELSETDFRDTVLDGTEFHGTNWKGAVFQNAKFRRNKISGIKNLEKAWVYPIEADGVYFKVYLAEPFSAVVTKRTMMLGCLHRSQEDWFRMTEIDLAVNTCGDANANPEWKKWSPHLKRVIAELDLKDMEA